MKTFCRLVDGFKCLSWICYFVSERIICLLVKALQTIWKLTNSSGSWQEFTEPSLRHLRVLDSRAKLPSVSAWTRSCPARKGSIHWTELQCRCATTWRSWGIRMESNTNRQRQSCRTWAQRRRPTWPGVAVAALERVHSSVEWVRSEKMKKFHSLEIRKFATTLLNNVPPSPSGSPWTPWRRSCNSRCGIHAR